MSDTNNTPSTAIIARTPADTGRPQEVAIVPQFRDLRNQVLMWNPLTGQPEWRLLGDVEAELLLGPPRPLLMNDTLPLLAGDGLPFLFRGTVGAI